MPILTPEPAQHDNGDGLMSADAGHDKQPYRLWLAGTLTLGDLTYRIEVQAFDGFADTHLRAETGERFSLRALHGVDDGRRQVISCRTGRALQVDGRAVALIHLGDVLESAA